MKKITFMFFLSQASFCLAANLELKPGSAPIKIQPGEETTVSCAANAPQNNFCRVVYLNLGFPRNGYFLVNERGDKLVALGFPDKLAEVTKEIIQKYKDIGQCD